MRVKKTNKTLVIEQKISEKKANPPLVKVPQKTDLKHIIELTQENQPNPIPNLEENCKQEEHQQIPSTEQERSCCSRYTKCIVNLWRFLTKRQQHFEIDINDTDFATVIQKIKNQKEKSISLLPPQKQNRKVLVLDLDETLIHTTFAKPLAYDYQSEMIFNGRNTKIYIAKRFGLDSFLFEMSKLYEIVIFTASQKMYADKVIDLIDPKKRISHRLYRQHCVIINKTYFIKNIKSLGRNTSNIIIVDDNNLAGLLQPENFYKIDPFQGNEKDRHLCRLSSFLKHLYKMKNFTSIRQQRKEFEEMEINLSLQDTSMKTTNDARSLNQRKRQYNHKKTTSQIETLVTKSTQDEDNGQISGQQLIKKI